MSVKKDHSKLSLRRQCRLLSLSRSTLYYTPVGESVENLALMRLIDQQFLETPWYGSRQMARWLQRQGHSVGRHRARRLMKKMGLVPIYQPPRTSQPHPEHKIYPYLLRHLTIERPNHVWCADITYIPMRRGFLYLVAIMDWYSRRILSWELSTTMDKEFCLSALDRAMRIHGVPEIFNSDQGSQFTCSAFREKLEMTPAAYIRIYRLNAAHRELLAADPKVSTVTSVALKWGFSHPGRFSSIHRKMFNEAPSEALRKVGV